MKLYNIHKSNHFDDLYYEGSSFIVGNKPNKFREEFLNRSCSYLDHIERKDDITIDHYHNLLDLLDFDLISKMNDEEMKKLVIFMKTFVSNSIIDFRELILEDVRTKYYKDRPSRYNCMWLTDEESLPFWIEMINGNTSIYELDVDGNIFVSTDKLLPKGHVARNMIYDRAHEYWNPKEEDLKDAKDKEYLFKGRVKVLKRIK